MAGRNRAAAIAAAPKNLSALRAALVRFLSHIESPPLFYFSFSSFLLFFRDKESG
jgi:hypothetical protein